MVKITITESYKKELLNNKFLRNNIRKLAAACDVGDFMKFMDDNPDFVQMMLHLASSDEIKVEEIE